MKDKKIRELVKKYMKKPYRIEIEPDPEGGYVAWIKELPGCLTYGETLEEVLKMLDEAKELYIETAIKRGKKLPEPLAERNFSGRLLLRLPPSLHKKLVDLAQEEGISLNSLILKLISYAMGRYESEIEIKREIEEIKNILKRITLTQTQEGWKSLKVKDFVVTKKQATGRKIIPA